MKTLATGCGYAATAAMRIYFDISQDHICFSISAVADAIATYVRTVTLRRFSHLGQWA
jgi:hypothetical protein